jgi:hypothetical protein
MYSRVFENDCIDTWNYLHGVSLGGACGVRLSQGADVLSGQCV